MISRIFPWYFEPKRYQKCGAFDSAGVNSFLELLDKEMRVAMTLTGAKTIADINVDCLVKLDNQT